MPEFDNLDSIFEQRLRNFVTASGGRVTIGEGFRTDERSDEMYMEKWRKVVEAHPDWTVDEVAKETGRFVAPGGTSNHNFGLAADLEFTDDGDWAHANASRFGLDFPVTDPPEPWHVQPIDIEAIKAGGEIKTFTGGGAGGHFGSDGAGQLPEPDDKTSVFVDGDGQFIQYELAPGVMISWSVPPGVDVSRYATATRVPGATYADAGSSEELYSFGGEGFATITDYVTLTMGMLFGPNDPAASDPGVLGVIAQLIGRPNMEPDEITALLDRTDYVQNLTDKAADWNDFSLAERQAQITEEQGWLFGEDKGLSGKDRDFQDTASETWMRKLAKDIAMGVLTRGEGREILENRAEADPESPWSRTLRDEGINRKQFGVDIENQSVTLEDEAKSWGLRLSKPTLDDWAEKITLNEDSAAGYLNYLKTSASALYPDKPPDMMTSTWAEPFTQTSARLMERATDLFDPDIQNALATGQTIRDFETSIKGNDAWLETKNAGVELGGMAAKMSREMGFS